ncbi:MAG: AraC family transcriptional regulator [Kaistia sp. SCN 65-12]|nr:MAG: AraC family transcriptional regulator [Kaistia sp. SCN 65-12]
MPVDDKIDVLSDVLSAIRLTGAVFYDVSARPPWVAEAPPTQRFGNLVMPGAQHTIEYHVVTCGSCWISIVDRGDFEPVELREGDIAVMPQGDPHALSSRPGMRAEPEWSVHQRPPDDSMLPFRLRTGSDGPTETHLVCGFFSCDARPFNPLLAALPRFMRLGRAAGTPESRLDQFIQLATAEAENRRPGSQSILNRLSELMFLEVVRRHMDELGGDRTGWLAGLRDPLVGRALALLHAEPARGWTLEDLAASAGASRSALAERFTQLVGCPPIQYLTRWRMQIAARRLAEGGVKIAVVAQEIGYDSEAAFSRAFKKFVGQSPSEWRAGGG